MSGGSFQYAYTHINLFADELEIKIKNNKDDENFNDKTIKELKFVLFQARKLSDSMKAVEWLYSDDIGEESFMEEIHNIQSVNKKEKRFQDIKDTTDYIKKHY